MIMWVEMEAAGRLLRSTQERITRSRGWVSDLRECLEQTTSAILVSQEIIKRSDAKSRDFQIRSNSWRIRRQNRRDKECGHQDGLRPLMPEAVSSR